MIAIPPDLVDRLRLQQCVLFAGAGLSQPAKYPSWRNLIEQLVAQLPARPPEETAELQASIAAGRLLQVADYCQEALGESKFRNFLAARFRSVPKDLPPVHRLVPQLPFSGLITTNYDPLFERAYGDRLTVRTHADQQGLSSLPFDPKPFLFKAHGDAQRPETMVLTERDYRRLIHSNPQFNVALNWIMFGHAILFAGYSLTDPDFRLWFDGHAELFGKGPGRYALMCGVGAVERASLLHTAGIEVLAYPEGQHEEIHRFLERLESELKNVPAVEIVRPAPAPASPTRGPGDSRAWIQELEQRTPAARVKLLCRPAAAEQAALISHFGQPRFQALRAEALQAARSSRWNGKRGRVVLIPGFCGSELTEFGPKGSQVVVWLNMFRLAFGRMESLRLAPDGTDGQMEVRATGIQKKWYAEAIRRLSRDWDVRVFWYDWRKDLNLAADALALKLQEWFGADPVCHLIGHDMGGLVARTFIKNHPDLWKKMWDRESEIAGAGGGRLVALGAPHCGSLTAPQQLTGTHDFIIKLGMVDLKHTAEEVRAIWATFPALYQMLPSPFALPAFEPLYDARSYGDLAVSQPHLNAARSFHERLRGLVDPWRMTSVLGTESLDRPGKTRGGLLARARLSQVVTRALDADPHAANQLAQLRTLEGQPVPTYYARASNGNLIATPAVLDELGDLLETGICLGLPTIPE